MEAQAGTRNGRDRGAVYGRLQLLGVCGEIKCRSENDDVKKKPVPDDLGGSCQAQALRDLFSRIVVLKEICAECLDSVQKGGLYAVAEKKHVRCVHCSHRVDYPIVSGAED